MIVDAGTLKIGDVFRWPNGRPPHLLFTIVAHPKDDGMSVMGTARIRFLIFHPSFGKAWPLVLFANEVVDVAR